MGSLTTPKLQVVKESRDLLFELWDPLHISGTVEARNFKFDMQMDHEGVNEKNASRRLSSHRNLVCR